MVKTNSKNVSATALAKKMEIPVAELFSLFVNNGWIVRQDDTWELTDKGKENGGVVNSNSRFGSWIAWPENITDSLKQSSEDSKEPSRFLNATVLSKFFNVARSRVNPILSELGWIERDRKGWILTNLGKSVSGRQLEHEKTGIPYVSWPENILENKRLIETFKEVHGESSEEEIKEKIEVSFREKFEAKHRTADGHCVRSKAEMLIDNWLYMSEIVHAYERKLPIEEDVYCDFYLPVGKVYIEYWGIENEEQYLNRKKVKVDIYNKYGFNLIELVDHDIKNLDDILPKKLLKFGIQSY